VPWIFLFCKIVARNWLCPLLYLCNILHINKVKASTLGVVHAFCVVVYLLELMFMFLAMHCMDKYY
jgi:hypothetical protein